MNNSQTNDSNPCCNGQWSRTAKGAHRVMRVNVS